MSGIAYVWTQPYPLYLSSLPSSLKRKVKENLKFWVVPRIVIEGKSSDGDTGSGDPPIDFLNMQEFPLTSVFGYRAGSDGVYPQWTQMVQKKKNPQGL